MAAATAASPATAPSSFPYTTRKSTLPTLRVSRKFKLAAASLSSDPSPAFQSVTAFAPATVANLGPGFDFLGCAVADASLSLGDTVVATLDQIGERRVGKECLL